MNTLTVLGDLLEFIFTFIIIVWFLALNCWCLWSNVRKIKSIVDINLNSLFDINWSALSINIVSPYTHYCQFLSWLGLKKQFPHCSCTDSVGLTFLSSLYSSAKKKKTGCRQTVCEFKFHLVCKALYLNIKYFICNYSERFLLRFHESNIFECTTKHFTPYICIVGLIMTDVHWEQQSSQVALKWQSYLYVNIM